MNNFLHMLNESDPKTGTGKKPEGSGRRLYTDEDPTDTVRVKFKTAEDIKHTLSKKSFKSKSHARQSQIINLIHQRVRAAYKNSKDPEVRKRLKIALDYAEYRKELSKKKTQKMKKENIKKESLLFTDFILESIAEENNIDEGKLKNFFKKKVAPFAVGAATALAVNNPELVKKPFSQFDKTKTIKTAEKEVSKYDYVSDMDTLLMRQLYKESGLKPGAVSPRGATGLAQIMPSALKDYSRASKIDPKKVNLKDPKSSIKVQIWAMKNLYNASFINKPNQSEVVRLAKTLAAYNWGRGNLNSFLTKANNKGIDIYNSLDWVSMLPIETSDYINKILLKKDPKFERDFEKAIKNSEYTKIYKELDGFN